MPNFCLPRLALPTLTGQKARFYVGRDDEIDEAKMRNFRKQPDSMHNEYLAYFQASNEKKPRLNQA